MTQERATDGDALHDLVDRLSAEDRETVRHLAERFLREPDTAAPEDEEDEQPAPAEAAPKRKISFAGMIDGPPDLSEKHDEYLHSSGYGESR